MSKKLLLADDSITIQKVIQITFSQEDYQLTIVDNGDAAYAQAKVVVPDLVLADVYMPGKNGYELCAAIKQTPALRHVPVLLLTGSFEAFDEGNARAVGADDWIEKPFESQALIDKVAALLRAAPAPEEPEPAQTASQPGAAGAFAESAAAAAVAGATAEEWGQFGQTTAPPAAALAAEDFIFEEIAASEANFEFPEEAFPSAAVPETAAFEGEDEILPLEDDDILGGEDLEPIDDVVTLTPWSRQELPTEEPLPSSAPTELPAEEPFTTSWAAEPSSTPAIDLPFSGAAPAAESVFEFVTEPAAEIATEPAAESVTAPAGEPLLHAAAPVAAAEPRAMLLNEEALERIVERAVVKAIEQLAGTTLERVAWEVVPDLAESLIKEEIRKIKEAVG